jgi:hypothetical protein
MELAILSILLVMISVRALVVRHSMVRPASRIGSLLPFRASSLSTYASAGFSFTTQQGRQVKVLGKINANHQNFATVTEEPEEAEIVEEEDFMDIVADAVRRAGPALIEGLGSDRGYAVVDEFLTPEWMNVLRREAVDFYKDGSFEVSKSSRFDPTSPDQLVTYDKHNVFAMQLNGGEDYYKGPRLHEYVVSTVRAAVPLLGDAFPAAQLDSVLCSNKLAVCTGSGSAYDKHYDNAGYTDTRKVTILLYMNDWREEMGGQFRIFGKGDETVDIEPHSGRLLAFWSDLCVHSVLPSEAPNGESDHRYALTLWLTTKSPEFIVRDNEEIRRHFG